MAWKVVWTHAAWNDLEVVADFIAKDSKHYSAAFVREVQEAASSLSHHARRGRIVPELSDSGIRELFVGNYRPIYQIGEGDVYMLALIHGSRDLWKLWEQI